MNSDSKRRQCLKKQILSKVQVGDIGAVEKAANFLNSPKKWDLIKKIEMATNYPTNKNPEDQKFILCFDYFNKNTCCFEQFDQAKGKKLLEIFEQITKCEVNRFPELRLIRDSVGRTPDYNSLFATVSPEVDKIHETELCEGRLFFFITEPRFNIVSVETKHRNIDK
jgi:hypothetical protein